ncbi:MAG: alpha/beta fold hydrolase [bacterium]
MSFTDVEYSFDVKYVKINGVRTAFIDEGKGHVLIFLHGNGSDLSSFDLNYPKFVDSYRVIGVDLPGFGKSDKPIIDYTAEWYVDHLKVLLQKLGVKKCTMIGHSFGGLLALRFSSKYPDMVASLVLVDAAGTYKYPPAQEAFMRSTYTPEKIMASTPEQIKMSMQFGLGQWEESYQSWVDKWVALSKSSEYKNYAQAVHRVFLTFLETNLTEQIQAISVPALIIWGEYDAILPLSAGRELNNLIQNSQLVVLKGTGHFPMLTQHEKFNQAVFRFLQEYKK